MTDLLLDTLHGTLTPHLGLSKSRVETLTWVITGIVKELRVNLSHLASTCSSTALPSSNYRRLQRFFQFVTLDQDWSAQATVKLLNLRGPWTLCLDRTNWKFGKKHMNILMLVVVTKRLRMPLMWTVLDRDGASNQEDRIALMQRYLAIFGAGSIKWLLCDREFHGNRWIEFLLQNNVQFAIRVKANSLVYLQDGTLHKINDLLQKPTDFTRLQGLPARLKPMDKAVGTPLTFAAKRLNKDELLIVASNGPSDKILKVYRKRWQIECLFGDTKTRGFNLEETRLTQPAKLNTLLIIICLAMAWAYACAKALMGRKSNKKGADGYFRKSWFRIGLDQLRNWISQDPEKAAKVWRQIWPKRKSTLEKIRVV